MLPGLVLAALLVACNGLFGTARNGVDFASNDLRTSHSPLPQASEYVYLVLSAEIAGQRGDYAGALEHYLEAAKLTPDPKVAERATQIALYAKNLGSAAEAAALWSQRDPSNTAPKRISAILNLKQGNLEQGVAQLRTLLSLPSVDVESTLIELVKMLDGELSKEDGLRVMKSLQEAFPHVAEVHFAYALLATNKGEYALALDQTQKALSMQPRWSRAQLLQAQLMSQMGDSESARDIIRKAVSRDPANDRLRLILAQFLTKTGDLRGAERELKGVLSRDPGNDDARFGLAVLLLETGKEDSARAELRKLLGTEKWRGQASFYLGLLELRQNHLPEALVFFDSVDSGPSEFDARVNAVTVLVSLGRVDEARGRLSELRQRFPNESLRLYLVEADLLVKRKEPQAAFDLLTSALAEDPGRAELLYSRALIADQLGRADLLEADLRAVIEKSPNDANALNALGFTLADRNLRLDEAKSLIARAMQLKPNDPAVMDSWGWLHYRLGKLDVALDYLERAHRLFKDPEIAAHLGEVLWESGRREEARRVWRGALSKDPEHREMQRIRSKYREAFLR
ncbi:tetratricopeptide repeat protein [Methylotetracoccus oryzae]|uniref:tetratricopeptide repeat protein n=1 Tax=Methylotetracoccus oryzae TaxID=1919059 RepID=UPI001F2484DB|nr:tetratricopeptide repeat protein [Methylotetracoccus oryzae]